jgi:hypothetical protein
MTVADSPSWMNYFSGMNPIVHILRGAEPEGREVVTPITLVTAPVVPDILVEENDLDKIGFTVDVAMRLVAEQPAVQDTGSTVSYLEHKTPPDLADSA